MYSLPLREFVDIHLGVTVNQVGGVVVRDRLHDKRPIARHHAKVIQALTKNKVICYIEWPDPAFYPNADPILWDLQCWVESAERLEKERKRQHDSYIARCINERNITIIGKEVMKKLFVSIECGESIARTYLKHKMLGEIKWVGVTKLITKEEEL